MQKAAERNKSNMEHKTKLIVRGGGDLASGVIHRLYRCGYQVLVLECKRPSAIRREVSFGEAVYDGTSCVEGVTGRLITKVSECQKVWENGELPILVDESGEAVKELKPDADRCDPCKEKSWNNEGHGTSHCRAGTWL